ncbi:MAG: KOW domain-containing RNA-binding protein [Oscillospiraceae bacterium]|jgi:ribosomal protein L14E/L6E/L27E|nr:KOW domain-containing RNA-binding protein [Oscillospiraceae bacterium]
MTETKLKFAKSVAGRDSGTLYLIIGEDKGNVLLVDGKHHKLQNPKRKNPKHLKPIAGTAERLTGTDAEIRRILAIKKARKEVE